MIIDCTLFNSVYELDMLEIRLNVLKDVVDEFVILEGDHTFSGREKKEYVLEPHLDDRFRDFPISYFTARLNPWLGAWDREHQHRNLLKDCAEPFSDNDTIIVSDLDEIPHPGLVKYCDNDGVNRRAIQELFYFNLNTTSHQKWVKGTYILNGATARAVSFQQTRMEGDWLVAAPEAGWHFSSVLGEEGIQDKLGAFSHTEFDNDEARARVLKYYHEMKGIHGDTLDLVPFDYKFPEYLQKNHHKYQHLCYSTL